MRAIVENTDGYLFTGLFFYAQTQWWDDSTAWVSRPSSGQIDFIQLRDWTTSAENLIHCSQHPEHVLQSHLTSFTGSLVGAANGTSVVSGSGWLIIHSQLQNELRRRGFSHLRFLELKDMSPAGSWNIVPLFNVCADGPWLPRTLKTIPNDNATCIYCGKSPIVCHECGRSVDCSFCHQMSDYILPPSFSYDDSGLQLISESPTSPELHDPNRYLRRYDSSQPVLDLSR